MAVELMFFISVLACWRLVYLITEEHGPYNILLRMRVWAHKRDIDWINVDCAYCMSVWLAVPFAIYLAKDFWQFLIYWFAIAGGTVFFQLLHNKYEE